MKRPLLSLGRSSMTRVFRHPCRYSACLKAVLTLNMHAHPQDNSLKYRQGHQVGQHQATLTNAGIVADGRKHSVNEAMKKAQCAMYGHESRTQASR